MAKFDAVLFDVDGTLLHSSPGIIATMEHTFRAVGMNPDTIDLKRYIGPPLRKSFGEHFDDEETIERMVKIYRDEYKITGQHMCTPFAGVVKMLTELKNAGVLLYTATAKPISVVTPILKEQKLDSFFEFIGGATEDKSAETKTDVIRLVLSRPELSGKRVLMVGDRHDDMQGAQNCGVPAAAVMYGYGSENELVPFDPIFFAETCKELASFILS